MSMEPIKKLSWKLTNHKWFFIRRSRSFKENAKLLALLLLLLAYVRCIKEDWKALLGNESQEVQFQFVQESPVTMYSIQSGSQDKLQDSNNLADVAVSDKVGQAPSAHEQIVDDLEFKKIKMKNPKLPNDKIKFIHDTIRRANNRKGFAKKMAAKKQLLNELVHINDTVVEILSIKNIFASRVSQRINDTNELDEMPRCLFPPFGLLGPVPVDQTPVKMKAVEKAHPELSLGGRWHPSACRAKHRVAIIIPFRDRLANLTVFLRHIHPILQRQLLYYLIVVVDQADSRPFNRAQLLNIGALEVLKMGHVDCFVFHDVDHLPENDHILYNCPAQPLHLSAAVDRFNYSVPYTAMFGGVSAITVGHFIKANGYSNRFWGWGGEDNDMFNRIYGVGLNVTRYSPDVARYSTMRPDRSGQLPTRREFVNSAVKQFMADGLNSLHYRMLGVKRKRLYTRLEVETMDTKRMENVDANFRETTFKNDVSH